jgi:5-methylcytosine-specific restriction endonuclease McrA
MGNRTIREQVVSRQNGRCSICGEPISIRNCVLHHRRNRCNHGPSTVDNLEARCQKDERWAHANFPFGNPVPVPQGNGQVPRQPKRSKKERKVRYPMIARRITKSEKLARTLQWIEERCKT